MTGTQNLQSDARHASRSPSPPTVSDTAQLSQTIPRQSFHSPHGGDDQTQEPIDPVPTATVEDSAAPTAPVLDIEHQIVDDDPRLWSDRKKALCVSVLMWGAMAPTLSSNIFLPALKPLTEQIHATSASISLAVSLFILFQGTTPLLWSPVSELIGRKIIFISGSIIFTVSSLIGSRANSMALLIVMRCLAAAGSSPMLSVGAGTLADMYEPHQRGTIVGLYYAAPLIGPAISPIIGGALTEADSWRATFYFLTAAGFTMILCFTFVFKETFRPARSIAWTQAKERALRKVEAAHTKQLLLSEKRQQFNTGNVEQPHTEEKTQQSQTVIAARRSSALSASSSDATVLDPSVTPHRSGTPPHRERPQEPFQPPEFLEPASPPTPPTLPLEPAAAAGKRISIAAGLDATRQHTAAPAPAAQNTTDEERRAVGGTGIARPVSRSISRAISRTQSRVSVLSNKVVTSTGEEITFKPSLADVNPIRPFIAVLSEPHNIVSLVASGLSFGSYYSLSLTVTLTLTAAKGAPNGGYGFSPIIVGCVLLAVGGGGMTGSIIGGRLSDRRIRRIKSGALVSPLVSPTSVDAAAWHAARAKGEKDVEAAGQERPPEIVVEPEERLVSCKWTMIFVPFCYITYGWLAQNSVNIGALCAVLFMLGASLFSVYACTLSYVVDSNKGRGSSAVACNSAFRGSVAFVASEIASTLLRKMGNGWLYTGWAIALAITESALFFIAFQGPRWRREGLKRQQDWRFLRPQNWKA
ncbi:hypothetical protein OC861_003741 [Tilletia horrida]|nr:hypothetical protein OC861_003741 [Tilletia horrida]